MPFPINKKVVYTFCSAGIIILGSFIAIRFAEGYRISRKGTFQGTGLLNANSFPSGAEVYINGKLVSATDQTISLEPAEYQVEIRKEGYTPWQKKLRVENSLVTQTNAQLYRRAPGLTPLTFTDVHNLSPAPDGQKLLFYTASASAKPRNGLYVLELSNSLLTAPKEARQVAEETNGFDLGTASLTWSPDNTQVLLSSNGHDVLLDINRMNSLALLPDVGLQKNKILSDWEYQLYVREKQFLQKFPEEFIAIATQSAKNMYLSPDKKKLLYTATAPAKIPENLAPPLPASDTQPESRTLTPGFTYIYDREEDRNFLLSSISQVATTESKKLLANDLSSLEIKSFDSSPSAFRTMQATNSAIVAKNFANFYSSVFTSGIQWFPDSKHVLFADKDRIYLLEYDNTNKTAIYSGPFSNNFIYPWPDGSKILILTSFSSTTPQNLYAIELK